ncbi:hypothetical protein RM704_11145 [Streptomyces sp. DSM 3412]|uniref:Uncharacterized protein n=1 Tax=Streptomyces gottesmaniae TaxID=3075518 RepID=A0ABU2YUU5_9ACTN|nr:hypothetical protein [Streptomyces sp. DSM 3412]MDT0568021.1 hypothetical protein [Streptomyces sp. DSM 3412]
MRTEPFRVTHNFHHSLASGWAVTSLPRKWSGGDHIPLQMVGQ